MVRGIGAYSISNGQVRFVPAVDTTALAAMFVLVVGVVVRARRRRETVGEETGALGWVTRLLSTRVSSPP